MGNIHNDSVIFQTVVASEGYRLSAETVEKVVDLQARYQLQNHSIDFVDFLINDETEVLRRLEEAERYLVTLMARRTYEDRV